jgi:hypothetical protein
MRNATIPVMVGHGVCLALALIFVSWKVALLNFFLSVILVSIYKALHGWLVWVYGFIILCSLGHGLISAIWDYRGSGFLIYGMIMGYYCIGCYKMFTDSHSFRNLGNPNYQNSDFDVFAPPAARNLVMKN